MLIEGGLAGSVAGALASAVDAKNRSKDVATATSFFKYLPLMQRIPPCFEEFRADTQRLLDWMKSQPEGRWWFRFAPKETLTKSARKLGVPDYLIIWFLLAQPFDPLSIEFFAQFRRLYRRSMTVRDLG